MTTFADFCRPPPLPVYNKAAFKKVGIEAVPKTWSEFLADAHKLKDAGIIPVVTNFSQGWPLTVYDGLAVAISGDGDFLNKALKEPAPFSADKPYLAKNSQNIPTAKARQTRAVQGACAL